MNQQNPDNLTPEQYGQADGWRLLDEDENGPDINPPLRVPDFFIQAWRDGKWTGGSLNGLAGDLTYRTRLTRAELRAARGLPNEIPEDCVWGITPDPLSPAPASDPVAQLRALDEFEAKSRESATKIGPGSDPVARQEGELAHIAAVNPDLAALLREADAMFPERVFHWTKFAQGTPLEHDVPVAATQWLYDKLLPLTQQLATVTQELSEARIDIEGLHASESASVKALNEAIQERGEARAELATMDALHRHDHNGISKIATTLFNRADIGANDCVRGIEKLVQERDEARAELAAVQSDRDTVRFLLKTQTDLTVHELKRNDTLAAENARLRAALEGAFKEGYSTGFADHDPTVEPEPDWAWKRSDTCLSTHPALGEKGGAHPLEINSRCVHGNTGFEQGAEWVGCEECAKAKRDESEGGAK